MRTFLIAVILLFFSSFMLFADSERVTVSTDFNLGMDEFNAMRFGGGLNFNVLWNVGEALEGLPVGYSLGVGGRLEITTSLTDEQQDKPFQSMFLLAYAMSFSLDRRDTSSLQIMFGPTMYFDTNSKDRELATFGCGGDVTANFFLGGRVFGLSTGVTAFGNILRIYGEDIEFPFIFDIHIGLTMRI